MKNVPFYAKGDEDGLNLLYLEAVNPEDRIDRYEARELFDIACGDDLKAAQKANNKFYLSFGRFVGKIGYLAFPTFMKDYYGELIHAAWCAILERMDKYDPKRSSVSTFFYYDIIHAMQMAIDKEIMNTSEHYRKKSSRIRDEVDKLKDEDKPIDPVAIAVTTGYSIDFVNTCLANYDCKNYEGFPPAEDTATEETNPEYIYMQKEGVSILYQALEKLPPINKEILISKWGVFGHTKESLSSIAKRLNMPLSAIQLLDSKSREILKKNKELSSFHYGTYKEPKLPYSQEVAFCPKQSGLITMEELESLEDELF